MDINNSDNLDSLTFASEKTFFEHDLEHNIKLSVGIAMNSGR